MQPVNQVKESARQATPLHSSCGNRQPQDLTFRATGKFGKDHVGQGVQEAPAEMVEDVTLPAAPAASWTPGTVLLLVPAPVPLSR